MAESSDLSRYHQVGELEKLTGERLPPTPITQEATEVFIDWGLTPKHIEKIREFAASFRYDKCREKLERLVSTPVFIKQEGSQLIADLPYAFDLQGRLDGQCGDIGRQFLFQAEFSGLIDDLNAEAQIPPGYRIVPFYSYGQSETHFCKPGDIHVWNGFALYNDVQRVADELVIIDAAFQTIKTASESNYHPESIIYEPQNNHGLNLNEELEIGEVQIDNLEWQQRGGTNGLVLGRSEDGKYTYEIGFFKRIFPDQQKIFNYWTRSNSERQIIVELHRTTASGHGNYFLIHPDLDLLIMPQGVWLTNEEREEILGLLRTAQQFQFNYDLDQYPYRVTAGTTIKWNQPPLVPGQ